MNVFVIKLVLLVFLGLNLMACTQHQIGTSTGAAAGAGLGYAVTKSGWGAAIGGGAGALIGHEVTKHD
jgi:hypothetical protein